MRQTAFHSFSTDLFPQGQMLVLSLCALVQVGASAVVDYATPAQQIGSAYRGFDLAVAYSLSAAYAAAGVWSLWKAPVSCAEGRAGPKPVVRGIWRVGSAVLAILAGLGIATVTRLYSWHRLDGLVWAPAWVPMSILAGLACYWQWKGRELHTRAPNAGVSAAETAFQIAFIALSVFCVLLSLAG